MSAADAATTTAAGLSAVPTELDVLVVGAGFSGLHLLERLREAGFSTAVVEAADDVGGTWYWNRYPGARCDIPTTDYTYSFDPDLEADWTWSEKYATQPEILRYLRHVADRYDLRRDIAFETTVRSAVWDGGARRWRLTLSDGSEVAARHYVMATGCLSVPKEVDIEGADRFAGEVYWTSRWPHEGVDLTGKRVAVIGTGSSGIQSIPLIARQAAELTVFQRTPNYSIPAHNGPASPTSLAQIAADREAYRVAGRTSRIGVPGDPSTVSILASSEEERRAVFERAWEEGTLWGIINAFSDTAFFEAANELLCEMIRDKIRSIVEDPETAEALCPRDHPFGTKRPCLDSDYYATYNLPQVRLVDLRKHPISTITETGIDTVDESLDFDAIVYATGFDAMTGALVGVDVTGRDGLTLADKWADGPETYLGLTTVGFPNYFMITGPQSPSVFSNMAVSIEQHVDWVVGCLRYLREHGFETIEPTPTAEAGWRQHCADCGSLALYDRANSWYMGANVPGKPRVLLPYAGGVGAYRVHCDRAVAEGYLGFELRGPGGTQCNDGVVARLQPDVVLVLELLDSLGLPPIESMSAPEARIFWATLNAERPPGPEVGEMVDGTLPGPAGPLGYRLYRPSTPGPHPVVLYLHGGGWVLGDQISDEPMCRDLVARGDVVIVSVNYRHAPEDRFPAAAEDALAAARWVGDHLVELGGIPGQLAIAGWSAGGGLAAVVAQAARDGGPDLVGQLLLTPVTDSDLARPSYEENADGYVLTAPLMRWFWDLYTDPEQRLDPRVAPLRAPSLAGLPPAVIVTADFDPLRDEGRAYADALEAAGVPVTRIRARGHIHTSVTMVDQVLSGAPVRAQMAEALAGMFRADVPG